MQTPPHPAPLLLWDNGVQLACPTSLSRMGNGIKLRKFLSWWKPAPRLRSPGTKLPGYPQTPRWGVSTSPSGAVEGSRGFQPPVHEARNDPGA